MPGVQVSRGRPTGKQKLFHQNAPGCTELLKQIGVFGIGGLRFSVDISKPSQSASALLDFQTNDNIWTTQPAAASWFQMFPCVCKSNGWNHRTQLEIITKWGERCVMPQMKGKQVFKFLERYDFFNIWRQTPLVALYTLFSNCAIQFATRYLER